MMRRVALIAVMAVMQMYSFSHYMAHAAATEVPFFFEKVETTEDFGAVNENFRAVADSVRRTDLTNGGTIEGGLTVTGANNNLIINGANAGITFPDNTTQTTAVTAFSHTFSSFTITGDASDSNAGACVANSTITIACTSAVMIYIQAQSYFTDGTIQAQLWVLEDGDYMGGADASNPLSAGTNSAGSIEQPVGFHVMGSNSASTSYCLQFRESANAGGGATLVAPINIAAVCID